MEAVLQELFDLTRSARDLLIGFALEDRGAASELSQASALSVRHSRLAFIHDVSRRNVLVGFCLCRVVDVGRKEAVLRLGLKVFEGRCAAFVGEALGARKEGGLCGGRAGHDAPKQSKGCPIADTLTEAGQCRDRLHQLSCEGVDVVEELAIALGNSVRHLFGITVGEWGDLPQPGFHVGASALDEMPGQFLPLALRQGLEVQFSELGLEQAEQRQEGLFDPAVRRRGQQDKMPVESLCEVNEQLVALLLGNMATGGLGAGVNLIHNDEFGAVEKERMPMPVGLRIVHADHEVLVIPKDAVVSGRETALQLSCRAGAHDLGVDVELLGKLLLPLVTQMRWAQNADTPHLTPVEQFAGDQGGFDRLTDPNVVADHEPHRFLPQCHEHGNGLVGTGAHGHTPETAERTRATAETEPRRVPQQSS